MLCILIRVVNKTDHQKPINTFYVYKKITCDENKN